MHPKRCSVERQTLLALVQPGVYDLLQSKAIGKDFKSIIPLVLCRAVRWYLDKIPLATDITNITSPERTLTLSLSQMEASGRGLM